MRAIVNKLAILMLCLGMFTPMFVPVAASGLAAEQADAALASHGPIKVNSDSDLASVASSGNGLAGNPYIIENLDIDPGTRGYCIFIGNTTAHLIIRNCALNGATYFTSFHNGKGVFLYNVQNCTVQNNDCSSNYWNSIYLSGSGNNTIIGNTCNDAYIGIGLANSNDNIVENNLVATGRAECISLDRSDRNTLHNNSCSLGTYGIGLWTDNDNNIISNNSVFSNTASGISLFNGNDGNQILGNNCSGNVNSGIFLNNSLRNEIADNNCSGNAYGIRLNPSSDRNNLTANYLGLNSADGLLIFKADQNKVMNNTLDRNTAYGIDIWASTGNALCGNRLLFNNGSVYVWSAAKDQAFDNGTNVWYCAQYGNYWSDWASPDNNVDGIVDSAYSIQGGSDKDVHPLANPLIVITSPNAVSVNTGSSSITVTGASNGFRLIKTQWYNKLTGQTGVCTSTGTSTWSGSVPLAEGSNVLQFSAVSALGMSSKIILIVVYDTDAPVVTIQSPPSNTTSSSVTLTVTAKDDVPMASANWTMYRNGHLVEWGNISGKVSRLMQVTFYQAFTVSEGVINIRITANDSLGNAGTGNCTFYCELSAPLLTFNPVAIGDYVSSSSVNVSWTCPYGLTGVANFTVSIDGGSSSVLPFSQKYYDFSGLADGRHTVRVKVTTNAGNQNTSYLSFTTHTAAPVVAIALPAQADHIGSSFVNVTWSVTDSIGMSQLAIRLDSGAWTALVPGNTTAMFSGLADGDHTVEVRAIDGAGIVGNSTVWFTVDTVKPTVVAKTSGSDIWITSNVTVQFSEAMNTSSVKIMVSGISGKIVWENGDAVFVPDQQFAKGTTYHVSVSGTDLAGNSVEDSWEFTTQGDSVVPNLDPIIWLIIGCSVLLGAAVGLLFYFHARKK